MNAASPKLEASPGKGFVADLLPGLTTAAVVVPKALAYATIAQLPVQAGLFAAMVPMVVYAVLGTSRVLSVSTTTPIAILCAAAIGEALRADPTLSPLTAAATLSAIVGVMLIAARVARLGFLADFISEPVLTGFKAGVGFVIVDMRVKKLLKRLAATPMTRSDFLWSIAGSRLLFMIPELVVILGAGVLLFGMPVRGSWLAVLTLALVGTGAFAGLGMLVACRAQRIETVSGLMNAVMVPMWLLSGIFFSSERFPDLLQPLVQALPLTQLNDALRAVILEGASLASQAWRVLALAAWGAVSFVLALRWFRWM